MVKVNVECTWQISINRLGLTRKTTNQLYEGNESVIYQMLAEVNSVVEVSDIGNVGSLEIICITNRDDQTPERILNRPKLLVASIGIMPWHGIGI